MAIINMKSESKPEEMNESMDYDDPEYPYGLCITLGKEELEKLGITVLPQVGSEMMVHAKAYVKMTRAYDTQGDGKDMSVELQITDMAIEPAEGEVNNEQRASMLYGGGE